MQCLVGSHIMATAAEQLASAGNVEQLPKALRNILTKARTSWLRNQEVVDLLTNYKAYQFRVSKEPPQKPPGMLHISFIYSLSRSEALLSGEPCLTTLIDLHAAKASPSCADLQEGRCSCSTARQ